MECCPSLALVSGSGLVVVYGPYYSRVGGILQSRFTLRQLSQTVHSALKRLAVDHPSRLVSSRSAVERGKKENMNWFRFEFCSSQFGGIDSDVAESHIPSFNYFYFSRILF